MLGESHGHSDDFELHLAWHSEDFELHLAWHSEDFELQSAAPLLDQDDFELHSDCPFLNQEGEDFELHSACLLLDQEGFDLLPIYLFMFDPPIKLSTSRHPNHMYATQKLIKSNQELINPQK